MFIATLPEIVQNRKLKCPPMSEWVNKLWYVHIIDSCPAIKKINYIYIYATAQMDLKIITLSEKEPDRKSRYYDFSHIKF